MARQRPPRRTPTKTRTLRLADGGQFRIGPGTVSVPVSTIPLDPPAVVLHVNRSCGALELEPTADGVVLPPVRVDAARVLELVEQINADRLTSAIRGGRAEPPVELPPTFKGTARHVGAWVQQSFPFTFPDCAGYPSKTEPGAETLWVHRKTGACMLERTHAKPGPSPMYSWDKIPPARAVAWLTANGYVAIPATLHRLARTGKGAQRDAPQKQRRAARG